MKESLLAGSATLTSYYLLSSLGFAFAHWWVYQGSMNTILYLFGVGLVLMTVGYTVSPALGWGLHLLNNVVLITKLA